MRHVRMLGLCLVATIAVAATGATSASALPEFGRCVAQTGGKYTESNCVKKAKLGTGTFEFKKANAIPVAERMVAGSSGAAVLRTKFITCEGGSHNSENVSEAECISGGGTIGAQGPISVECAKETNTTEISPTLASKEVRNVNVRFEKCAAFGQATCANTGEEGVIETEALKGKLGWINKSAKPREVGLLLEPAAKGGEFAKFECQPGITTHVGGAKSTESPVYPGKGGGDGIISPIVPVNTMTTQYTQEYKFNEAEGPEENENIPSKFEGTQPLKVLEDWGQNSPAPQVRSKWSKAGESLTNSEKGCSSVEHTTGECVRPEELNQGEIKAN